jgi:hypothetical protein
LRQVKESRWSTLAEAFSLSSSALRSGPNVNQTVAEPAFIEKFELHADLDFIIA